MHYSNIPKLTPNEEAMPLAKYYHIPLAAPNPLAEYMLNRGPSSPSLAVPPEKMEQLLSVDQFTDLDYGYCMMPDGSGYVAFYVDYGPNVTAEMVSWYWRWVNILPKSSLPGQGNLKYKLLHQLDHVDHRFVNNKDYSGGVYTLESLDNGQGEKPLGSYHHGYRLADYGVSAAKLKELEDAGCQASGIYETFDEPGTHLCMNLTRTSARGTTERLSREWIGYRPVNGHFVRDPSTPVDEAYLRNVLIHNEIEHSRMAQILPDLYREYHLQPDDAD